MREDLRRSLFTGVKYCALRAHVLLRCARFIWVRVLCIRCEESTHEFGIESPPYKKRWKYPRISAFLRRLFRKLKDVFFFKAHMCNAFFLWTPHASDESRKPDVVASSKRLHNEEEEACNNTSSSHREGRETACGRGEDSFVSSVVYVEWEGRRGMKRGEKRLLDFLFFFFDMHEIFSKFVARKERLLNFLFCQYYAKKSSASVCVVVC